jgi:peptide/nickel transport system permease protein
LIRYLLRRLAVIPFVLLGMTLVTFAVSQIVPTDPLAAHLGARGEPGGGDPAAIQQLKERWGWDKPVWERYVIYLGGLAQGDLGESHSSRREVVDDLAQYTPATLELVFATMIIALLIAVPLGVLAAARRDGPIDAVFKVVSVIIVSTPVFWLGILALGLFYRDLGWAAGPGRLDIFLLEPPRVTGLITVDSLLAGRLDAFGNALHHLALPAGLLGLVTGVYFARIIRSEMVEALGSDYVRTARGKGLVPRLVLYRHALRNAIVPAITLSGLAFGSLLTGAIVVESIFGWPGLGSYAYRAATKVDLPAIAGVTLVVGTIYMLLNVLVDLLYAAVDPRVRVR